MTKNKKVVKPTSKKTITKKPAASASTAKKPVSKAVNKPVKKTASPSAKKTISKVTKAAAKAPAKSAAPKAAKTVTKAAAKAPTKATAKVMTKTPAKAAVTKATKPAAPKTQPPKVMAKVVAKSATKPAQKPAQKKDSVKQEAAPIIVKMPNNENQAPQQEKSIAPKMEAATRTVSTASVQRPVYRPIQVINKPLAPVQPQRAMATIVPSNEKVEFSEGDYVVYPAHGVGQIEGVETQKVAGMEVKLYAIVFEKDRMRLKVPVFKAHASGLRRLSTGSRMQDALKTLQGRAQIRRAMWSRRAQEYETKINSGDPVAIAEVLRDLKRNTEEIEQSYSERQIYQSALERLAREVAALEKITEIEASERLETLLRGGRRKSEKVAVTQDDVAANSVIEENNADSNEESDENRQAA